MPETPDTLFAHWEELPGYPGCEYGVPCNTPDGVEDCGKAASWRVWWGEDKKDAMFVCEEHAKAIEESEAKHA